MLSHFFIDRPIFATVLSIVITLAGLVALFALPIAQYPDITPPTVLVTAIYPGANAKTVLDTVAAPIEQQVSGVENALYMASQCTNDGAYRLVVTFKLGMDSDMAQVLVQNRVQLAMPQIPDIVQREGVAVKKVSPSTMMIVNLVSSRGKEEDLYLSNYATIQLRDELLRLPGVGDVTYLGQRDYSMRAWLDPEKLASLELTADDVTNAIAHQNIQVAAGQIGQEPAPPGQQFQLVMTTLGRLEDPEQFANIVVKAGTEGDTSKIVRLKDVCTRVELGAQQYDQSCRLNGESSVALSIFQLPGSNAIKTAQNVYDKMKELKTRFPPGLDYRIVYDTTPFIRESIVEVVKTLRDAIVLVGIVVLVFLQNWRATVIPLVAVPVAIIGTFFSMALFQFSLNNLSLFGLVLAIGIVVDDAIVVVENVERWLDQGLSPRDAARKAMDEVTGPVIAVALVLCAVFVPCAFIAGITGQFFRQFAITVAVSTALSAFNSLTLSPALAALLLKPHDGPGHDHAPREPLPRLGLIVGIGLLAAWLGPHFLAPVSAFLERHGLPAWTLRLGLGLLGCVAGFAVARLINAALATFFRLFNDAFNLATGLYVRLVGGLLRACTVSLLVYGGLLYLTYYGFAHTPTGFIPQQDKGYLLLNVQLPDSASVQRTQAAMKRVEDLARSIEGVADTVSISGMSLLLGASAPNFGSMYVMLEDFDRRGPARTADAIAAELQHACDLHVREAQVGIFGAPPVDGLGTVGGFKIILEDRGNLGLDELQRTADALVADGNSSPQLRGLFTSLRSNTPWLYLDIDRDKCMSLGIELKDVFDTLQVYMGSLYVNNFNKFGRSWQVNIQADSHFRHRIDEVALFKVRNKTGQMVPLGTLASVRDVSGPVLLLRYNMYSSAAIFGDARPGVSSGQAIDAMQALADKHLPNSMTTEWTEITYFQLLAGNTAILVFAFAVLLVFLVLAAQYESWSLPLAVILVVPMCLLCSIAGVQLARMDVNIFTQIGFVVLVGLASKNAILIVEFAKQQREAGVERMTATLEACRLRLRPIMMTSFAFILGVVPLVLASGAGAEMRQTLGTAVFSGMLGVTFFGIFLTPIFFFVIDRLTHQPAAEHDTGERGASAP